VSATPAPGSPGSPGTSPTPGPGGPNDAPAANFKLTPPPAGNGTVTVAPGEKLNINMCASSDPDADKLSYSINWGDGSRVVSSSTCRHDHSYATGRYRLVVEVSDGRGVQAAQARASASFSKSWEVVVGDVASASASLVKDQGPLSFVRTAGVLLFGLGAGLWLSGGRRRPEDEPRA
jgi:hypothetical protein